MLFLLPPCFHSAFEKLHYNVLTFFEEIFIPNPPTMLRAKDQFLIELLECGILDLQFFFRLLEKLEENNLYLDTHEVLLSYGGFKINNFISEALYLLAE